MREYNRIWQPLQDEQPKIVTGRRNSAREVATFGRQHLKTIYRAKHGESPEKQTKKGSEAHLLFRERREIHFQPILLSKQ
jgi:hypothetical protein